MALSFERKITFSVIAITCAYLPLLLFAILSLASVQTSQKMLDNVHMRTLLLAGELKIRKREQTALMPDFVISGNEQILARFHEAGRQFEAVFAKLNTMPLNAPIKAKLQEIWNAHLLMRNVENPGIELRRSGGTVGQVDAYFRDHAGLPTSTIIDLLDSLTDDVARSYDAKRSQTENIIGNAIFSLAMSSVVTGIFTVVVVVLVIRLLGRKTEVDRLESALNEQERALSLSRKEAIESVAHDLRNPLSAVVMAASFLDSRRYELLPPKFASMLQIISSSADAMERLISALLDHAKIEAGTMVLAQVPVDIVDFASAIVARTRLIAERMGVNLSLEHQTEVSPVMIDRVRMEQVFTNLLGNAIKFTPSGGSVVMVLRPLKASLEISIADTGCGMTDEQTAHVFDRYWQVSKASSSGAGLGMSIAKAIVQAHGGTIIATSELGRGSVFRVQLPLETPSTATACAR